MAPARRFTTTLAALLVLALPGVASAAEGSELRIAVVDIGRILEEAPQAKIISRALKDEFSAREQEILDKQRELQELEQRRQRDGDILSDQDLFDLMREINQKDRILTRRENEYLEDLNLRRNEEIARMQRVIVQEVQLFASEVGYDIVVGEGVLYVSERAEITDQVLQRLEARARSGSD